MTISDESVFTDSFDHLFNDRSQLLWWPWIGAKFASSPVKTIIVGESIYEWNCKAPDTFSKRYAEVDALRITHKNHALDFERNSPYVRNIERAIFAKAKPSREQKQNLWMSVAYHNLVLRALRSRSHKDRPGEKDYRAGWIELLNLCNLMKVEQCLVYGLESPKINALKDLDPDFSSYKRLQKVGRSRPLLATVKFDKREIRMLLIRHPSAYFSWEKWSPVIRENLSLSFDGQ